MLDTKETIIFGRKSQFQEFRLAETTLTDYGPQEEKNKSRYIGITPGGEKNNKAAKFYYFFSLKMPI